MLTILNSSDEAAVTSVYVRFEAMLAGASTGARTSRAPARLPLLERWLGSEPDVQAIDDWRSDAQRLLHPDGAAPLNAAPVAWCDAMPDRPAEGATVYLAQPLHAEATLSSVRLPAYGLLQLQAPEAERLAADFAALPAQPAAPGGAARLLAAGTQLFYVFDESLEAHSPDPAALVGFDLREFRPSGRQARRLAALGSEVEMWLFSHPLNQARQARGEPPITTLWPWGGGALPTDVPPLPFDVAGEDVLFGAWKRRAPMPPVDGNAGHGVLILCDRGIGADEFESLLHPHLAALRAAIRAGTGGLHVSAGRRRCSVGRMPRRWFAPRARPWWELFDETD